ncbi:MAG: hypothetical protein ACREUF_09040, partial [Solimonas sp.]
MDALEEVKVLTGNAAAKFGDAGGATVMLQLKSGVKLPTQDQEEQERDGQEGTNNRWGPAIISASRAI